jgi:integrase
MTMQRTKHPGVYRLPDGRFRTISAFRDPRTGLRKRKVDTWSTADAPTPAHAATLRLRALELELAGLRPQRMRLSEYAASWLTRKGAELAPSTVDRYGRTILLHILPRLGDLFLDALQPVDIVTWRDTIAKVSAPATTNSHLRVLREILADAAAELQLPNPAARVRQVAELPRSDGKALSADELGRVLLAMRELDLGVYAMLLTLALTGMRWSEASALQWHDLGETEIRIRRSQWRGRARDITKSKRSRTVPCVPELRAILEQHRAREMRRRSVACQLVWCTEASKPRSRTWASKALQRAIVAAEVRRVTPHGLRHTWNDLLRRVTSTDVQKAITGHVTEAMREHYSHVDADEKAAAALGALRLVKGGA